MVVVTFAKGVAWGVFRAESIFVARRHVDGLSSVVTCKLYLVNSNLNAIQKSY